MRRYLARRALFAVLLVFVVSSGAMLLTRLAPGDFASALAAEGASPAQVAQERARHGLDRPVASQYFAWLLAGRPPRSRQARSSTSGRSAGWSGSARPTPRCSRSSALAIATLAGLPAGVYTGSRRGGRRLARARRARSSCCRCPRW